MSRIKMINTLTIDLEDYFQVQAFSGLIRYEDWGKYESRVERNTNKILELLSGSQRTPNLEGHSPIQATFFCLGWIAERFPNLIREIQAQGHEIACHGYRHQLIYNQSKEEFRRDIRKAKNILEDITGCEIIGYRAPSYSITIRSLWALKILAEEGFKYDSSIFPIRHDNYGIPNAPRFPFAIPLDGKEEPEIKSLCKISGNNPLEGHPQSIIEYPLSTVRIGNFNLPISGGGYFRLFPYPLIKTGLQKINRVEGKPFIFYLHPWELDFDQPRILGAGLKSKIRHYINLKKTENRFKNLLEEFNFSSIKERLAFNYLSNATDNKIQAPAPQWGWGYSNSRALQGVRAA